MLDKDMIERIARECYPLEAVVFSCWFRAPIVDHGYLTKDEFLAIVAWKSPRSKRLAWDPGNTPRFIRAKTREALAAADAKEVAAAVRALCQLPGVAVRMASAILTVWKPECYTVMDDYACRALRNLGVGYTRTSYTPGTYVTYLKACTKLAEKHGVDLRTLDRYLWVKGQPMWEPWIRLLAGNGE